jgi:hypothetical protein
LLASVKLVLFLSVVEWIEVDWNNLNFSAQLIKKCLIIVNLVRGSLKSLWGFIPLMFASIYLNKQNTHLIQIPKYHNWIGSQTESIKFDDKMNTGNTNRFYIRTSTDETIIIFNIVQLTYLILLHWRTVSSEPSSQFLDPSHSKVLSMHWPDAHWNFEVLLRNTTLVETSYGNEHLEK